MDAFLQPGSPFTVAMLLYPNITQLDLTAPHQVFSTVPGVDVRLYWKTLKPVKSDSGMELIPTSTLDDDAPIDLLFVPGGPGQVDLMADEEVLDFLRRGAGRAHYVTSVCTGSLLLAAAGLLHGYRATTYWMAMNDLSLLGAVAVQDRVVIDRNRITGAGVTSGIDLALVILAQLWGPGVARAVQLALEYDPQPPFAAGSPKTASPEEVQWLIQRAKPLLERRRAATNTAASKLVDSTVKSAGMQD
jgi:cyclohexyl-isocyanide hydratase